MIDLVLLQSWTPSADGAWHYVVMCYYAYSPAQSSIRVFVDGEEVEKP